MGRSKRIGLLLTVLLQSGLACAQEGNILSLGDVLKRTASFHPYLLQWQAQVEETQGKRLAAEGAFDWQIEQESFSRTSGFYNGWFLDQSISRRLGPNNAKVSGGYRVSDGIFPIYEDIHRTLSGGEANLKFSLSLLRDRDTDPYRNKVANADLEVLAAGDMRALQINELLFNAGMAYLDWYQASHQREIYAKLLKLSEDRNAAIESKVQRGDLASITLTEFNATLLDRRAQLLDSERKALASARKLGFYVLSDMQTLAPLDTSQYKPAEENLNTYLSVADKPQLIAAMSDHPEMRLLQRQLAQTRNNLNLADNSLLPRLDLEMTLANDVGSGSESLDGFESYVGLKFSVPFEQREARGEIRANDAKVRQLQHKRQAMVAAMRTDIDAAFITLTNLIELHKIRSAQADVAEKLARQEQQRFDLGDSDLFLLNARERNAGLAMLKRVDTAAEILRQQLYTLTLTAQLAGSYMQPFIATDN